MVVMSIFQEIENEDSADCTYVIDRKANIHNHFR